MGSPTKIVDGARWCYPTNGSAPVMLVAAPNNGFGLDGRVTGNGAVGGNLTGNGTGGMKFAGQGGAGSGNNQLVNPLRFGSFPEFFRGLIEILIIFAIPIIVLMIIYAGFLYVMARGNEEQVTKATRALTYAVLGGLLIIGAELILRIIQGTVNQLII